MEFDAVEIKLLKAALGEFEWAVKETLINWCILDADSADIVQKIQALQYKISMYEYYS